MRLYGEDEAAKAAAAGHARWLLGQIVRLLHPFLPFVTEEIAAQYGETPLIDQAHPLHDAALLAPHDEAAVGAVQAAVNALRQFRAETKVPAGQVLSAVFVGEGKDAVARYGPYVPALRALTRTEVDLEGAPEEGATVVLVPGGRLEVAATVDKAEEIARLEQQHAKAEAEVQRGRAKLANEGFVSRAPEAVVQKERDNLAARAAERDELAARLHRLRQG